VAELGVARSSLATKASQSPYLSTSQTDEARQDPAFRHSAYVAPVAAQSALANVAARRRAARGLGRQPRTSRSAKATNAAAASP